MSATNKSVVRYSGEENLLLAVSSMLVRNGIDFVFHKEKGGYIRTIDMVDNENMRTMLKELLEKHTSVEIRIW